MKTITLIIILLFSGYSYAQGCDQFNHQFIEAQTEWNKIIQSITDFQKNAKGKTKEEIKANAFYSNVRNQQNRLKQKLKRLLHNLLEWNCTFRLPSSVKSTKHRYNL